MSGIAGVIDLTGQRLVSERVLRAMGAAIAHRGPDDDGYARRDGVALAVRRLATTAPSDGQQPVGNEDGTVTAIFHGALFNAGDLRATLEAKGHVLRTRADAELLPHLWEEFGEGLLERLRGQFAFALHDTRERRVILARDRFGICPLHSSRQGDWLLFGSEIKALLASGLVPARADLQGINHAFTFFALPGPVTCFAGVSSLLPGRFLDLRLDRGEVAERVYWQVEFPDQGDEDPGGDPRRLVERFEEVLLAAVQRRLRADVPVVTYLSGGVDSGVVTAMANKLRGEPVPAFTVGLSDPALDESADAARAGRHIGAAQIILPCPNDKILATYPRLVTAVEGPVIDTACAALLLLAERVHADGYKVALTGEGADEWLASYPWYKLHKLLSYLDVIPGLPLSQGVRQLFLRVSGAPRFPADVVRHARDVVGGHNGWLDAYGLMSMNKLRFFTGALREHMARHSAYDDLGLDTARLRRWHPLHRALYLCARVQLPGLLLHAKGDRITMQSAVENRYTFLDEDVFAFLARLHPRWKLRGLKEKYLLRLVAERWLPRDIAWKPKSLFRARMDGFDADQPPAFVDQLLSPESLRRTGYFDVAAVGHWRTAYKQLRAGSTQRTSVEMGLVGVLSTQLWHHLYIDPTLADLPSRSPHTPCAEAPHTECAGYFGA